MIFRVCEQDTTYVIEAPRGSKIITEVGRSAELALFEETPLGLVVERRLPSTVVVRAAQRGYLGLTIREARSPSGHPEVSRA